MKIFLNILLYLSFIFLFIYLYVKDLLIIPELLYPAYFFLSLVLVLAGFSISAKAWQTITKSEIPDVSYKDSFVSTGKFIFSKYIPGKLWVIIGKAAYLKERYAKSFINLTSFSFFYQLISLFSATVVSIGVVYFFDKTWFWLLVAVLCCFLVFFTVLYKPALRVVSRLLGFVFRKDIRLPVVQKRVTFKVFLLSLSNWIIWSISFYFFLLSTLPADYVSLAMGFLFPVSAVAGIIVVIAPGGLGIREGLLVIGLTSFGIQPKEAAAVAFISRLWFLAGEFLFFIIAALLTVKNRPDNR